MATLFENAQETFTAPNISQNKIIYIVIAVIIVGIASIFYFRPKAEDVTVFGPFALQGVSSHGPTSAQESILDVGQLNTQLGNNFTISAFIYMDDVNAERIPLAGPKGDFRFKPLLLVLGVGTVTVNPIHQQARISISPLSSSAMHKQNTTVHLDIDNFVVSRWNQLTITVEGRSVDVYLNGALTKSTLLKNVPELYPVGVLLETIPDFSGQFGLFQAWPRRLTEHEIARNYKRNTDTRGKPLIPEKSLGILDVLQNLSDKLCQIGICGFNGKRVGPLNYVDYEFA